MSEPKYGTYEEQWASLFADSLEPRYPVRVRPIPKGTWRLVPRTLEYQPFLTFWAVAKKPDVAADERRAVTSISLGFRAPPAEHLTAPYHDGEAVILMAEDELHTLMTKGFEFDLYIDSGDPVARAEVL
jgi:hypothetical protein